MDLREKLLQRRGFICDMDGVTSREDLKQIAYQPHHVLDGVGDISEVCGDPQ